MRRNEAALVEWLVDNESAVVSSAFAALAREYPRLRSESLDAAPDLITSLPEHVDDQELRQLATVSALVVHPLVHSGLPVVACVMECAWDEEHGVGMVLHGTRVLRVGQQSDATMLWAARQCLPGVEDVAEPNGAEAPAMERRVVHLFAADHRGALCGATRPPGGTLAIAAREGLALSPTPPPVCPDCLRLEAGDRG